MKNIIIQFLALTIAFVTCTTNVFANDSSNGFEVVSNTNKNIEETIDLSNDIESNYPKLDNSIVLISEHKIYLDNKQVQVKIFNVDNEIMKFTIDENTVIVENDNSDILAVFTYRKIKNGSNYDSINLFDNEISPLASNLAHSYDKWPEKWNKTSTYTVDIVGDVPTAATLVTTVATILGEVCPLILTLTIYLYVYSIYDYLEDNGSFDVCAYTKINRYCNILRKEYVGNTQPSSDNADGVNENWLDSPWIYGVHPEACRFLTELY